VPPKKLLFAQLAREELLKGVDLLADATRVTLGPMGRNVTIAKSAGAPIVTKDGFTVADEIGIADRAQNIGAQMIRAVAETTSELAGDGTTTATVLAQSIFHEGLKLVAAGMDPMDLKRGIDKAAAVATRALKRISVPCRDTKAIAQIATIAANSDDSVGRLMAEAIEVVGREGVITIEDGASIEDRIEFVDGMQFDRGYLSPYFINEQDTMSAQLDDPLVLLCASKCAQVRDLLPLLGAVAESRKPLLLIAEDFSSEVLALLVVNRLRGVIDLAAVKAPGFGDRRRELLQDIAIVTGGTVITADAGLRLETATVEQLGTAARITVSRDRTTIVDGGGERRAIDARAAQIRRQTEDASSDHEREALEARLAKLSGGVAIIRVGAPSEIEIQEKKARVNDALHAARAAAEEGILPGGGTALVRVCADIATTQTDNADQAAGVRLLMRAAEAPFRQIVANSGVDPTVALHTVRAGTDNFGYNVATQEFGDLVRMGVIDPTKVTRLALQNAVSLAGLLLTVEVAVIAADPRA